MAGMGDRAVRLSLGATGVAVALGVALPAGGCGSHGGDSGSSSGGGDGGDAGGSSGGTTVHGTLAGVAVPTSDTMAVTQNGPDLAYAYVTLTNVPGLCAATQRQVMPGGATTFALGMLEGTGVTTVSPGTFPVSSPGNSPNAVVTFEIDDPTCKPLTMGAASSGSVTLTAITATTLTGTFDVTFPDGEHVSGTFEAPVCDVQGLDGGAPVCGK
jgi:hypothetical protein